MIEILSIHVLNSKKFFWIQLDLVRFNWKKIQIELNLTDKSIINLIQFLNCIISSF